MASSHPAPKQGSIGRRTSIAVSWLILWRAISRVLGIGTTIVLARLLVPADFGIVAMAMSVEGAIQTFALFPVHDALMRRREREAHLYDTAFTIQAARAIGVAILLAIGAPFAADWFHEPRLLPLVLVLAISSAANGFENIGMVDLHREMRFDVDVKISVLPSLLQLLVTLGVAWFTHSYWALLAGLTVRRFTRVGMTYAFLPMRPRFSLAGWRDLIGFSTWLAIIGIVSTVWERIDTFVVGPIFGPTGLGLYTLAAQVGRLPMTDLLEPAFAAMFASFASTERSGAAGSGMRRSLLVAGALVMLLAPITLVLSAEAAHFVTLLLGAKWAATVPLIQVMAWMCLFAPLGFVGRSALLASGRVRSVFLIVVAATLVRTVLVVLAGRSGALGLVIWADVAAIAFEGLVFAIYLGIHTDGAGRFLAGTLRMAVALGLATLALRGLGWGWHDAAPPPGDVLGSGIMGRGAAALLALARSGMLVCAIYGASLLAGWWLCGRPDGAERLIGATLAEMLPARLRRGKVALTDTKLAETAPIGLPPSTTPAPIEAPDTRPPA
ncbi:MAG: oligosaccharide flippase family protein [Rhodospirillales bacterium]|nr:oligosaccharide flippase family protein [Rhodospirillales bacterium]